MSILDPGTLKTGLQKTSNIISVHYCVINLCRIEFTFFDQNFSFYGSDQYKQRHLLLIMTKHHLVMLKYSWKLDSMIILLVSLPGCKYHTQTSQQKDVSELHVFMRHQNHLFS